MREYQYYRKFKMVEKLKDAAKLLKAKITQDDLQEKLVELTSEDNWQASTKQLHQIANETYNYQKWEKVGKFIWEKLRKGKSWRKILKTLNLVEFLIKNGPPNCIGSFKYQIYLFTSFENYSYVEEGVERGQAIREKGKAIAYLLNNDEFLQQERIKAKTIKEKMLGLGDNPQKKLCYGGEARDINKKYQSYDSSNFATNMPSPIFGKDSLGVYGDYGIAKSTLDKYKDSFKKNPQNDNIKQKDSQKTIQTKKPFQKTVHKLVKPNTNVQTNTQLKNKEPTLIDDFFLQTPKNVPISGQKQQPVENLNFRIPLQEVFTFTPNISDQQTKINTNIEKGYQYGQINHVVKTSNYQILPQFGLNQYQYPINNTLNNQQNQNLIGNQQTTLFPLQQTILNNDKKPITLSPPKNPLVSKKEEEQFGYFESVATSKINWLTNQEKNLTDFSDFGTEMKNSHLKQAKDKDLSNNIKIDIWNW